jgi:hypothetical protein
MVLYSMAQPTNQHELLKIHDTTIQEMPQTSGGGE